MLSCQNLTSFLAAWRLGGKSKYLSLAEPKVFPCFYHLIWLIILRLYPKKRCFGNIWRKVKLLEFLQRF